MKEITSEMYAALKSPLPKEAISQHPTKKFLSTIKAIYVTERLNEVFGVGKWTVKTDLEKIEGKMVVCKTILEIPDYGVYYECFGGNDNADMGDAFKGATTDAITKIGSYLGIAIDVFKGMKDAPATQASAITSKPVLPTLPTVSTTKETPKTNSPEYTEDSLWFMLETINNIDDVKKFLAINQIDLNKFPETRAKLNSKFSNK